MAQATSHPLAKLISRKPERWRMGTVEDLRAEYNAYLNACFNSDFPMPNKNVKRFTEWRLSEI